MNAEVLGALEYIKRTDLLDKGIKRERILKIFPFDKLVQNNPLDYKLATDTCELFNELITTKSFQNNERNSMVCIFEHVLCHLEILLKHSDSSNVVITLLNLLNKLVKIVYEESAFGFCIRILNLTKTLAKIPIKEIRLVVFDIFLSLFKFIDKPEQFSLITADLADYFEAFKKENDIQYLAIIAYKVLNYYQNYDIVFAKIYNWIENDMVPTLAKHDNEGTLQILLEITILVYSKNDLKLNIKNISDAFLKKLTAVLEISQIEKLRTAVMKTLCLLIRNVKHLIKVDRDYNQELLFNWMTCLPVNILDWSKTYNDCYFIIAYLGCLHTMLPWSQEEILTSINKKINSGQEVSDTLLKCLCGLTCVFIIPNYFYQATVEKPLFQILKIHTNIEYVLTCTISQLNWLMNSDCFILRRTVFHTWLRLVKSEEDFQNVLEKCNVTDLVMDIIQLYPELPIVERIVGVIKKSENKNLLPNIEDNILKCNNWVSLGHLFRVITNISEDRSKNYAMCKILPSILLGIDDHSLKWVINYTYKLLTKLIEEPLASTIFFQDLRVVFRLLKSSRKDDNSSISALQLLRLLKLLQVKHELIVTNIPVDLNKIYLTSKTKEKMDMLVDFILVLLRYKSKPMFLGIKSNNNCLETYCLLFQIRTVSDIGKIFECLRHLLKTYNSLAFLKSNCEFVMDMCCNVNVFNAPIPFMKFLFDWLKILYSHNLIHIPMDNIYKFTMYQNTSSVKNNLLRLLQQLQTRKNGIDFDINWSSELSYA